MKRMPQSRLRQIQGVIFQLPLMMTCVEFEDFIIDYLDDNLPARQKRLFDLHMKVCRECREYLKAYRLSIYLARSSIAQHSKNVLEDVPEDLLKAVVAVRKAS
ncbi:MAG: anti-sigma factor family protein [Rhizobiaceae bacterium]